MRSRVHWPSAWQLLLSLIAAQGVLGLAFSLALGGMVQYIDPAIPGVEATQVLLLAAGAGLVGLLVLPSAWYALRRLAGREDAPWQPSRRLQLGLLAAILLFPLVLWLGDQVSRQAGLAVWLLPGLHLLAVGLPIAWFFGLGSRGLPFGARQRFWGALGASLVAAPLLIFILEVLILGGLVGLAVLALSTRPDDLETFNRLLQRLTLSPGSPTALRTILRPYLLDPLVGYAVLVFGAGIVPLVEELLKPLGVWLLLGRRLPPAQGFVLGLAGGAGYALFESLVLASSVESWATVAATRMGTSLLHVATSGLMGWALALAWSEGRQFLRLGLAYLAASALHGLWNALALLSAGAALLGPGLEAGHLLLLAGRIAPLGLAALAVILLIFLLGANRSLLNLPRLAAENNLTQHHPPTPAQPPLPAQPAAESGQGDLNGVDPDPV